MAQKRAPRRPRKAAGTSNPFADTRSPAQVAFDQKLAELSRALIDPPAGSDASRRAAKELLTIPIMMQVVAAQLRLSTEIMGLIEERMRGFVREIRPEKPHGKIKGKR